MTSKQEQFIQDLVQFYRSRGISNVNQNQFVVRLNGKIVDLHELYSYALEYGGSYRVNQVNLWEEIYSKLFRTKCVGANFAVALRQIYNRYLLQYEKSCSTNVNNEQWNEEEEEESSLFSVHTNHSHYSHMFHHQPPQQLNNVTETSGKVHNDTKLYCSLLSGLPNELHFAFNIATILSNCNRFDWANDYKFINVLIESLKSYCCVCDQIDEDLSFGRTEFTDEDEILNFENYINYSIHRQFDDVKAKSNGIDSQQVIVIDDNFEDKEIACPKKEKIEFIEQKCSCYMQFWHQICTDEEVLNLVFADHNDDIDFNLPYVLKDFPLSLFKRIEQRVELVTGIVRNTSFTYDENNCNNVTMVPLLKFLLLLLRSENTNYVNQSLDILSNIAPALSLSITTPFEDIYFNLLDVLLSHVVEIAMNSNNIHNATKAFEIMARYISKTNCEANQKLESHFDNSKLHERITQLLTCQYDITLLLALLEFCLAMSESKPFVLVNSDNKTFIKILVNLLNCDSSKYFTIGALKKVKIIDDRPQDAPQVDTRNVASVNQTPQNVTVVNNTRVTPNLLDNESFAYKWLKMTYDEAAHNSSISINDIYGEYVKHCCRNLRRNVIAAQSFSVLLRTCFPSCNINVAQSTVEGLVMKNVHVEEQPRQTSNITHNPNQLMSPILKAHLSTPPKNNLANESNATPPPVSTATTNTSTLIKSLLANKLRNNQIITTQPLVNSSGTPVIVQQNEVKHQQEGTPQKGIIFSNNPSASFPPTLNIQNNLIVPNSSITQPQVPGSQQIYLVRTIITGPGQQNPNQPVRLLVPASMITQPRLPAPCVVSTSNGVVNNNVVQTPAGLPSQVMPAQIAVSTGSVPVVNHSNSTPLATANAQSARVNSVANSSPLLNVLLDKGKLPDFPTQTNQQGAVISPNVLNNNSQQVAPSQTSVQPQTKMLILTTNTPKSNVCKSSSTPSAVAVTPNLSNNVKTNQVLLTTPVVNGDINKADQAEKNDSDKVDSQVGGKRLLEEASIEVSKHLKTSVSTDLSISNGCEENISNATTSNCTGEDTKINCESHTNSEPSNDQSKQPETANPGTNLNSTPAPVQNSTPPVKPPELEFECQWNGCQMKFARASEVFYHVHSQHIMVPSCSNVMNCLWGGPEGRGPGCLSKRPKLSLLTHLQDFHCNANILKQESLRKKQLATLGTTNIMLPQPPAHPGYAQNAAMVAIYRHNNVKTIQEPPEPATPLTPLNVSIRLTAALILRNLAKRSHTVKKSLELFEPQLCEISIAEGRDESRTIAQCLAMLNENS